MTTIFVLSLLFSSPLFFAWNKAVQWNPCDDTDRIYQLKRTKFGENEIYILVYNRLCLILVAYCIPSLLIIIFSMRRAIQIVQKQLKLKQAHTVEDGDTPESPIAKVNSKKIPNWFLFFIPTSYIPVGIYSILEHLDVSGLPEPGVRYIIHLVLSIIWLAITCWKAKTFPDKFLSLDYKSSFRCTRVSTFFSDM